MSVKQLSVFVENKPGRLAALTRYMANCKINLRALSIADTQDFGIVRLITEKPEEANEKLREAGYLTKLNRVLAVSFPDRPGALADVLEALADAGVGVEYTYAFVSYKPGQAYMVFRVDDDNKYSEAAIEGTGARIIEHEELFS